jgi:hypothetical protein
MNYVYFNNSQKNSLINLINYVSAETLTTRGIIPSGKDNPPAKVSTQ